MICLRPSNSVRTLDHDEFVLGEKWYILNTRNVWEEKNCRVYKVILHPQKLLVPMRLRRKASNKDVPCQPMVADKSTSLSLPVPYLHRQHEAISTIAMHGGRRKVPVVQDLTWCFVQPRRSERRKGRMGCQETVTFKSISLLLVSMTLSVSMRQVYLVWRRIARLWAGVCVVVILYSDTSSSCVSTSVAHIDARSLYCCMIMAACTRIGIFRTCAIYACDADE